MSKIQLVGDVGGTNARFALLDSDGSLKATCTLPTSAFESLSAAVRAYLTEQGVDKITHAAVAVATPVVGDEVKLTNNKWSFSIEQTRLDMGIDKLHVTNDFTALALSVNHLPTDELLQVGGGQVMENHAKAIIGPGTGLGVSGLVPCGSQWSALQGEGGHVSIGVRTAREIAVYEQLMLKFKHVSAERFLSGPGLINIVSALRQLDGLPERTFTPAEVTEFGKRRYLESNGAVTEPLANDISEADLANCEETLHIFCALLGSCAGNLVLTLGAEGGVYIGGGIVPRLGGFFTESQFRQEFEAKGRMRGYLEKVPSFVINSPYPALVGAAQLLV